MVKNKDLPLITTSDDLRFLKTMIANKKRLDNIIKYTDPDANNYSREMADEALKLTNGTQLLLILNGIRFMYGFGWISLTDTGKYEILPVFGTTKTHYKVSNKVIGFVRLPIVNPDEGFSKLFDELVDDKDKAIRGCMGIRL